MNDEKREYIKNWLKKAAESLTPYAAEIRYPDDFYLPTAEEARNAFQKALQIKEVLFEHVLKEYMES